MTFDLTRDEFIVRAGCSQEEWERSSLDWSVLLSIAKHHDAAQQTLILHAGAIANRIQAFNKVHSVRWRVKNTYDLLKKILRKNLEPNAKEKWKTINLKNYRSVVSDLIGVRALHLLKEDCIDVDEQIRETWDAHEITIFKRDGDSPLSEVIERGAAEEPHNSGYRSIHYGISYKPEKQPVLVEIQVRTIFQEGWSEIDHKVKYPDFSNNESLISFLSVFNGLAGTADEMGSFVIRLDTLIKAQNALAINNETALAARDSEVEILQQKINELRKNKTASTTSVNSLQTSVDKIKERNTSINTNTLIHQSLGISPQDFIDRNKYLKDLMLAGNSALTTLQGTPAQVSLDILKSIEKLRQADPKMSDTTKQTLEAAASTAEVLRRNKEALDSAFKAQRQYLNSLPETNQKCVNPLKPPSAKKPKKPEDPDQ